MTIYNGSSAVSNGLVFAYDMGNTQKSWRGKPTTNTCSFGSYNFIDGNGTVTRNTTAPVPPPITGYEIAKLQSNDGSEVQTILYTAAVDQVNGGVYTHSAYIYLDSGTFVRVGQHWNPWDYGTYHYIPTKTWTRVSYTLTNATNNYGNVACSYNTNGVIYITATQYELGSFATPFVGGTRSNTQAILDLTGRSSIISSGLTYNSDNTFEFNYINSPNLTIPLSTSLNKTEGTMNFWVYPTRYNGGNGYFVNREDNVANAADWMWIGPYSGTFYFRFGNGSDCCSNDLSFSDVPSVIPLNTWTNMCFTWKSNNTSEIYKNGLLYTSRTIGNIPLTSPASNGKIGLGHNNADDYFHGKMPIVQIYNRQLSAAEVRQNFNASRARFGI